MAEEINRWEKAKCVAKQTEIRIQRLINMNDENRQRALLAKLRHGIGRKPGEMPELWGMLLDGLPDNMRSERGEPTREEWVIYTSLTMYALHQQGKDMEQQQMHVGGVSLGRAAFNLCGGDADEHERVGKRFNKVALADNMDELAHYLRGFIQLLRASDVTLDYVMLAKDLYLYQFDDLAPKVRLRWGQDFYTFVKADNSNEEDKDNA